MAEPMQPVLGGSQATVGADAAATQKKKRDWRPGKLCGIRHTIMRKAHAFHQRTGARVFVAIQFKKRFYAYTSEPKPSPRAILKEQQRKPCRKCEKRERHGEFPPPLSYIRNTIRRDIWHAQDLEGLPLRRQFIKPINQPRQPTQPTPVTAPQDVPAVPHGQPPQAGHSLPTNAPGPHILPPQPAPTMAQRRALHTGHGIYPAPSEPHVHYDQHSYAMAQGQTLYTDFHMLSGPPEPYYSHDQRAPMMPVGQFPPAGQSVYLTSPEPSMRPTYPDPMSQPGNDSLVEAPGQVPQHGGYLQPQYPLVQDPDVIQEDPLRTADLSSGSSGPSESSDSESSESSDESESGDSDTSSSNSDSSSPSPGDEAADERRVQNVASTPKQAGALASPIDLCGLDDSEDADSTSGRVDDSDEAASLQHLVLPHARSQSCITSAPDPNCVSMDIDSPSPEPSTPLSRRPAPMPTPLPGRARRTPRGSINKPGLFPSPPSTPTHMSRRARHPGFKRVQRGTRDEILGARAAAPRRPVFSARHELRPPSMSARITRSHTALQRQSESPGNTIIVDEGSRRSIPARGLTTGDEMDIPTSPTEAPTARKAGSAPRAQSPTSQDLPANLRRVKFYIPIKTVRRGRASTVGKQH